MAIVSQTWTRYPMEDNPLGVGVNYTVTTFIDHLIAWFTANTAQWVITSSGSDGAAKYIELKPAPGTAIDPDDRLLIWGGATVNAAGLSQDMDSSASYVYICYAPGAGTTGFDVSPNTGNPYTGVISTKMMLGTDVVTTYEKLDVYMSDDCIAINLGQDSGGLVTGLVFCGRAYQPIGTTDQFTLCAGLGKAANGQWTSTFSTNVSHWSSDQSPAATDTTVWIQESAGDVAWNRCYRSNMWVPNAYKNAAAEDKYFFPIDLHENIGADKTKFKGRVLFARGGPADAHGQTKSDGTTRGYSQSTDEVVTTEGTYYLWNE